MLAARNSLEKGHAEQLSHGELLVYNDAKGWYFVGASGSKRVMMKLGIRSSARVIKIPRLYCFSNSGDTQVTSREERRHGSLDCVHSGTGGVA